jgi:hypothetical protein
MNLPPFVYTKAFWEAATTATAGVLALLVFLGYLDASWAVPAAVMLTWVYSFLRLFGIEPEARLRELEARLHDAERRLRATESNLMTLSSSKPAKTRSSR